jgi:hypothetical protein
MQLIFPFTRNMKDCSLVFCVWDYYDYVSCVFSVAINFCSLCLCSWNFIEEKANSCLTFCSSTSPGYCDLRGVNAAWKLGLVHLARTDGYINVCVCLVCVGCLSVLAFILEIFWKQSMEPTISLRVRTWLYILDLDIPSLTIHRYNSANLPSPLVIRLPYS